MAAAYLARGAGPLTDAQAPYSGPMTTPSAHADPAGQTAPYYVRDIEWYHSAADIKQAVINYGAVATCWGVSSPTEQYDVEHDAEQHCLLRSRPRRVQLPARLRNQPNHAVAIVGWNDNVHAPPAADGRLDHPQQLGHQRRSMSGSPTTISTPATTLRTPARAIWAAFPSTMSAEHLPADLLPQRIRLDRSAALRLRLQPFHRRPERIAEVGQLLHHRRQRRLHGQRLRAVPERRAGALAATVSGTEAYEGFHTIDLPSLVPLAAGQDFYIELQTSNGQQANDGNISLQRLLDFQNPPVTRPRPRRRAKATSATMGRVGPTFTAWTAPTARTSPSTAWRSRRRAARSTGSGRTTAAGRGAAPAIGPAATLRTPAKTRPSWRGACQRHGQHHPAKQRRFEQPRLQHDRRGQLHDQREQRQRVDLVEHGRRGDDQQQRRQSHDRRPHRPRRQPERDRDGRQHALRQRADQRDERRHDAERQRRRHAGPRRQQHVQRRDDRQRRHAASRQRRERRIPRQPEHRDERQRHRGVQSQRRAFLQRRDQRQRAACEGGKRRIDPQRQQRVLRRNDDQRRRAGHRRGQCAPRQRVANDQRRRAIGFGERRRNWSAAHGLVADRLGRDCLERGGAGDDRRI